MDFFGISYFFTFPQTKTSEMSASSQLVQFYIQPGKEKEVEKTGITKKASLLFWVGTEDEDYLALAKRQKERYGNGPSRINEFFMLRERVEVSVGKLKTFL